MPAIANVAKPAAAEKQSFDASFSDDSRVVTQQNMFCTVDMFRIVNALENYERTRSMTLLNSLLASDVAIGEAN